MRLHVVDLIGRRDHPLLVTLAHHGCPAAWAHAAERIAHLERSSSLLPSGVIPSLACRASTLVTLRTVDGAVPALDHLRASRLTTDGHSVARDPLTGDSPDLLVSPQGGEPIPEGSDLLVLVSC